MREYPSTKNLYTRDPDTHLLNFGDLVQPEVAAIGSWLVTEKVDGTNMRVLLRLLQGVGSEQINIDIRGRSDRANVAGDLKDTILNRLQGSRTAVFEWMAEITEGDPLIQVCIYGEGYGAGINGGDIKGSSYRPDKSLRIFDVTTTRLTEDEEGHALATVGSEWWRDWATVEAASRAIGFPTVPVLLREAPREAVEQIVQDGIYSLTAFTDEGPTGVDYHPDAPEGVVQEGVVARTDPYLYDWRGNRVMFKYKTADVNKALAAMAAL